MDYFAKPKALKTDDLEVTGVSRSGRVRKKSSKLVDFESDDLSEQKLKRHRAQQQLQAQQLLEKFERSLNAQSQENFTSKTKSVTFSPKITNSLTPKNSPNQRNLFQQRQNYEPPVVQYIQQPAQESTSENDEESSESGSESANGNENDDSSSESSSEDEALDPLHFDEMEQETEVESTGFTKLEPPRQNDLPSQSKNSLYMLEKYRKKLIIKDGKVINKSPTKLQRKDKGQTRFTAYMLWAKEVRPSVVQKYPELDFAGMSKKLGEMWALVPSAQKYNWKRRAKRAALRPPKVLKEDQTPSKNSRKFINKTGSNQIIQLGNPLVRNMGPVSPPDKDLYLENGLFKVTGTQPIDVAAHLALLGESLTIIGERLKEHEGQMAVSGTVPVLLDTLLCALGSMVCLTQQVVELNGASPETLSSILKNVAIIMPGL